MECVVIGGSRNVAASADQPGGVGRLGADPQAAAARDNHTCDSHGAALTTEV